MATAKDLQKAPVVEEEAVSAGNCMGELVLLPATEGVTYNEYKCQVCGAVVHVGHEHLAEYGLPTEHARPEEG